jgi:hypothetical protein
MSQKTPILLLFFFFLIVKNTLYASINPPDTCMTMLLHSGKKLQVSAVQMSAKIISFRNCENYNRAQAIALDSILSITDAKGGRFYTAGDIKPQVKKIRHKIAVETAFWHRPWFYIDEKKVSQAEFDSFLWENLKAEDTEYILKKNKLQRTNFIWEMIGNGMYLLLLVFTITRLTIVWLFLLPFAITAAIFYRIYNGKVARAYNDITTAYYKQFK